MRAEWLRSGTGRFWHSHSAAMGLFSYNIYVVGWWIDLTFWWGRKWFGAHGFEADEENWLLDAFIVERILRTLCLCSATMYLWTHVMISVEANFLQWTSPVSHNAPFFFRNVEVCTFLLQNGALWDLWDWYDINSWMCDKVLPSFVAADGLVPCLLQRHTHNIQPQTKGNLNHLPLVLHIHDISVSKMGQQWFR